MGRYSLRDSVKKLNHLPRELESDIGGGNGRHQGAYGADRLRGGDRGRCNSSIIVEGGASRYSRGMVFEGGLRENKEEQGAEEREFAKEHEL